MVADGNIDEPKNLDGREESAIDIQGAGGFVLSDEAARLLLFQPPGFRSVLDEPAGDIDIRGLSQQLFNLTLNNDTSTRGASSPLFRPDSNSTNPNTSEKNRSLLLDAYLRMKEEGNNANLQDEDREQIFSALADQGIERLQEKTGGAKLQTPNQRAGGESSEGLRRRQLQELFARFDASRPQPISDTTFDSYIRSIDSGSIQSDTITQLVPDFQQRQTLITQLELKQQTENDRQLLEKFRSRALNGLSGREARNVIDFALDGSDRVLLQTIVDEKNEIDADRNQIRSFTEEFRTIVRENDLQRRIVLVDEQYGDDIFRLRDKRQELLDRQLSQERAISLLVDVIDSDITAEIAPEDGLKEVDREMLNDLIREIKTIPEGAQDVLLFDYSTDFRDTLEFVRTLPTRTEEDVLERRRIEGIVLRIRDIYNKYNSEAQVLNAIVNNDFDEAREYVNSISEIPDSKALFDAYTSEIAFWEFEDARLDAYENVSSAQDFKEASALIQRARGLATNSAQLQLIDAYITRIGSLERKAFISSIRRKYIGTPFDEEKIFAQIDTFKARSIEDIDQLIQLKVEVRSFARRVKNLEIREAFRTKNASAVLNAIADLPTMTDEDRQQRRNLFGLYREYTKARARIDPQAFEQVSRINVSEFFKRAEEPSPMIDLGINKEAFEYARQRFLDSVHPLVETFRSIQSLKDKMDEVVPVGLNQQGESPRVEFLLRLRDLAKQRELSDIEQLYVKSVELLSVFTPYLVGLARADFGATSVYLQQHFESLSDKTKETLSTGDYVPALVIGAGVHGVAAMSELARQRPDLAENALVVDQGTNPGGPFAWVLGEGWRLNSANGRRTGRREMPDTPQGPEEKTVRLWSDPTGWYPGQRSEASPNARVGDINAVVPYSAKVGDISPSLYATNEELQLTIALNAAMCIKNIAFQTKVLEVVPLSDGGKGDKLVTLEITNPQDGSSEIIKIRTDVVVVSTGLGKESFGFDVDGTRAEGIIADGKEYDNLPKLCTTKDAFAAIADRTEGKTAIIGETLVIYGSGNSKDTLIENITGIFDSGKMSMSQVKKIYIVSSTEGTSRPRYGLLRDISNRLGRENLVEFVQGRVGDVGYAAGDFLKPYEERRMLLYNENGDRIRNAKGELIIADNVIAATGFKSEIGEIFKEYGADTNVVRSDIVKPIGLPTNPDVSVGLRFRDDPNILILGTASPDGFNAEKFAQLPGLSSAALRRVGAENAVAIGFRVPDTLAAMNIWLQKTRLEKQERNTTSDRIQLTPEIENGAGVKEDYLFSAVPDINYEGYTISQLGIRDKVNATVVLSALTGKLLKDIEVTKEDGSPFFGEMSFDVSLDKRGRIQLRLAQGKRYTRTMNKKGKPMEVGKKISEVSRPFMYNVTDKLFDPTFQRYILYQLANARGSTKKIRLQLGFSRGRINPQTTYVSGGGL